MLLLLPLGVLPNAVLPQPPLLPLPPMLPKGLSVASPPLYSMVPPSMAMLIAASKDCGWWRATCTRTGGLKAAHIAVSAGALIHCWQLHQSRRPNI